MIDTTPQGIRSEIESAERLRDSVLTNFSKQLASYHGPWYHESSPHEEYSPENHYFEYMSLMVPRLVYDNPRFRVTTRRPGTQRATATAIRHGLNRWIRDTDFRQTLRGAAADCLFNFGIVLTSQSTNTTLPIELKEATPMWPTCERISQRLFFVDPQAQSFELARYTGHKFYRDKDDLLKYAEENEAEGWNPDAIKDLSTTGKSEESDMFYDPHHHVDREEIALYEVWVRDHELDDSPGAEQGFNGTIFTIAVAQTDTGGELSEMVREPRPYYGPRWGPYTMIGIYDVPDQVYPLAPLVAVQGQVEDLNIHATTTSASADAYKRLVLTDSTDPKFTQKIKDGQHNYVIPISGLDKSKMAQVEIGGITAQQLQYLNLAKDRLDRNSGMHDAMRGNVVGRGPATEVSGAAESASIRVSYIKQQFQAGVEQVCRTVAWYMYHDDRVVFPLGNDAAEEMAMKEPWLIGGTFDPESGATFDDIELEIEPYSMERTSEARLQEKTMAAFQMLVQVAPGIPQMPWIDWKGWFARLGDSMNMPELADLVNVDIANMVAGMQESPHPDPKFQPRLGGDAGKARPIVTPAPAQVPDASKLMAGQEAGIEMSESINSQRRM